MISIQNFLVVNRDNNVLRSQHFSALIDVSGNQTSGNCRVVHRFAAGAVAQLLEQLSSNQEG